MKNETRRIISFNPDYYPELVKLGRYNYNKAEKSLEEHIHHNRIEICYYDKGSQWFYVGDKRYLVKGGEAFLHFPGEVHGSGGFPEGKGRLYWLIIELSPLFPQSDQIIGNEIVYLCNELIRQKERHFTGTKEMKQILEEIFFVYRKSASKKMETIIIRTLVKRFLLLLLDCIQKKHSIIDQRLTHVLQYIDKHISTSITISVLADLCCLSESRFKNLFKEQTGFTPGDYIQRKRIQRAIQLLKQNPNITVSNVAYQFNFSSPQYLSSVVKKYTGLSPSILKGRKGEFEQITASWFAK